MPNYLKYPKLLLKLGGETISTWEEYVENNYSNSSQDNNKQTKNVTRGNRGKELEERLIRSNKQYKRQEIAQINKIPIPITVTDYNQYTKKIEEGHYRTKSLVDFIGTYKGRTIGYEAKETKVETRFDLSNLKEHQYNYLKDLKKNGGVAFIILAFTSLQEVYLLPFSLIKEYWKKKLKGGRKSIPYSDIANKEYKIEPNGLIELDYIPIIEEKYFKTSYVK